MTTLTIQNLITEFTTSQWTTSCKSLISLMKTYDKKISNLQLYFNAKKFNNTNKVDYTDFQRYNKLIEQIIILLTTEETLKNYCSNFDFYIQEISQCLITEQIYEVLKPNFMKGSYSKMIDDFNRILLPKTTADDDEEKDPTENMKKYIKGYSQNFINILEEYIANGFYIYKKELQIEEIDNESVLTNELFKLLKYNAKIFSIYTQIDKSYLTLWISNQKLDYENIELNEFIHYIEKYVFTINPEHLTNMDTIKRNYINKQTDLLNYHVNLLLNDNSLFFYKADYLHSADYNNYTELQYANAINSFPTNFEDYARNTFALFYFDKIDEVKISSFWITNKPIQNILPKYEYELFHWNETCFQEFINSSSLFSNAKLTILH
jgi:hypothetical protein